MRITMKALCALPTGALEPGRTYDVPTARAKSLVAGGYAVPADEDPAAGGTRKRKPARKKNQRKAEAKPVSGEDERQEGTEEGSDEDAPQPDLSSMSVEYLRSLARDRDVDPSGRKADLVDRLRAELEGDGDDDDAEDDED